MNNSKIPQITSLATVFIKRTGATVEKDVLQERTKHRAQLQSIMNKYFQDVQDGKAEGIRNAKELVEVMKADLLMMGDPLMQSGGANQDDDSNKGNTAVEETRVAQIAQVMSVDDPNVQALMQKMFKSVNDSNDKAGALNPGQTANNAEDTGLIKDPMNLDHAIALAMDNSEDVSSQADIRSMVFEPSVKAQSGEAQQDSDKTQDVVTDNKDNTGEAQ